MDETQPNASSPSGGQGYSQFHKDRLIQSLVVMILVTVVFYVLWG